MYGVIIGRSETQWLIHCLLCWNRKWFYPNCTSVSHVFQWSMNTRIASFKKWVNTNKISCIPLHVSHVSSCAWITSEYMEVSGLGLLRVRVGCQRWHLRRSKVGIFREEKGVCRMNWTQWNAVIDTLPFRWKKKRASRPGRSMRWSVRQHLRKRSFF